MPVQIVEANDDRVRVVELLLQRPDSPLRFVLYPMPHIGSPQFYREVTRRLAKADVIVTEGVGPSRAGAALTMSYRAMAEDQQLRLMVQHLDYDALTAQVICPDSSGEQFQARWQTIPRWQRVATLGMIGSVTAAQRLFGSRWLLTILQDSSLDDLPTNEEVLQPVLPPDVERLVLDERDERLLRTLYDLHDRRAAEPITVAVVYGAQHMRAVTTGLSTPHGYKVRAGDWLTVMVFD